MAKAIVLAATVLSFLSPCRAQDTSIPFLLGHRNAPSPSNPTLGREFTVTVPALSELRVQLLSGIHSRISHVGDPVKARVLQPVYVNGRVALPPGSFLDGRITRVQSAGRMHRPAELSFRFERITLPDGQAEVISTVLAGVDDARSLKSQLDPEGYLKGARFFSKGIAASVIGLGALGVPLSQLVGSSALKTLFPLGGAGLLGYEILWPRGNEVHLPPDTRCRIRLKDSLTVRTAG